jgi:hypothetical protein
MYNSRGQESTPIAHGKLPTFFLNFSKKKNSKPFQSASARTLPKHRFGEQTLVEEVTTGPRGKISTSGWVGLGWFHDVAAARSWRRGRRNGGQRMISWCSIKFPPKKPSHRDQMGRVRCSGPFRHVGPIVPLMRKPPQKPSRGPWVLNVWSCGWGLKS